MSTHGNLYQFVASGATYLPDENEVDSGRDGGWGIVRIWKWGRRIPTGYTHVFGPEGKIACDIRRNVEIITPYKSLGNEAGWLYAYRRPA